MTTLAPIAIFAFNRPTHLARCLESMSQNKDFSNTKVFLFIDGPKSKEDEILQQEMVKLIETFNHNDLKIIRSTQNKGLSDSLISGINYVLQKHESIIVIEDDLRVSEFFLEFINNGLKVYREYERVASIHAYVYPIQRKAQENFFIRGADCWGWGTWRRAWEKFEKDGGKLYQELKKNRLMSDFNLDGAAPFKRMLKDQINGKNDSWAIRWHASMYIQEMYTLYPSASLVENIGLDGSGVHSGVTKTMDTNLSRIPIAVSEIEVKEDQAMRNEFKKFFKLQKLKYLRENLEKLFIKL